MFNFNSIKVRLKHNNQNKPFDKPKFQFHKGTIKTPGHPDGTRIVEIFQFHKGTIKTTNSDFTTAARKLFQFHKGTIKTKVRKQKCKHNNNFNSIKVRLKLSNFKPLMFCTIISIP